MNSIKFFFRDKVYCGIVFIKIVFHSFDRFFDLFFISTFLGNYEALSGVFLTCCQFRLFSGSYLIHRFFHRNSILNTTFYTRDSSDCIRVSLAYAFTPECIGFSVWQNGFCIDTVQRKQTRIPAYRDHSQMTIFFCGCIYICKMLWNVCMGIKTVDDIKIFCQFRRLFWKVCSTSTTDDHNIDLILHILCIFHGVCFCARCFDSYCCRISSGKYTCQFHIFILTDRHLNAFSQIAITCNTDSYFFHR